MRQSVLVFTLALLSPFLCLSVSAQDTGEPDPLDAELDRLDLDEGNTAQKLLEEIQNNMKEIERLLDRKDTGQTNQARQVETVEAIEKLIEELNKT